MVMQERITVDPEQCWTLNFRLSWRNGWQIIWAWKPILYACWGYALQRMPRLLLQHGKWVEW